MYATFTQYLKSVTQVQYFCNVHCNNHTHWHHNNNIVLAFHVFIYICEDNKHTGHWFWSRFSSKWSLPLSPATSMRVIKKLSKTDTAYVKHNQPVISSSVQFVALPTMVPFAPLAPGTTLEAEDCSRDTVPPSLFVLVFIESFLFKKSWS